MSIRRAGLVLAVAAVAIAPTGAAGVSPRPAVTVKSSQFGRILFDSRGFVLYGFTRDIRGRSACGGTCARAWPPYIVKRAPRGHLLGTIRRNNASLQVTYAGHPLYYYVGDRRPGQILCQNVKEFGGIWRVVAPSGRLVGR